MTATALDAALAALTPAQVKALRTSPPERKISAIKDLRKAMEDAGIKVTATEAKDMLEQLQHAGNGKAAPAAPETRTPPAVEQINSMIADLVQLTSIIDLAVRGLRNQSPPSDWTFDAVQVLELASDRLVEVCDQLVGLDLDARVGAAQ